ncbi:hypothetical protein DFJ43DRAFT_1009204, partial [Lentinula guzmanii]
NVDGVAAGTWVSSRNLTYTKIFNASNMAPFDVPHITHDMILRFMGVDFGNILDGSAKIPSSVGSEAKPMYVSGFLIRRPTHPICLDPPSCPPLTHDAIHKRTVDFLQLHR